jgi:ABC-type Fe3+-hydroxamate transport system substrate-binding protein
VVSLVPSLTETLFDLGAGEVVVGVTDFCIFPPGISAPRLGGTKNPNVNEIHALKPDLVHMNLEENLKRHAGAIAEFAPVFVTEPKSVDDVASLITTMGAIHDRSERAAGLVEELRRERRSARGQTFTFACAIWKNPWMWCGSDTYVASLIAEAGGKNVVTETRYPSIDVARISADVVFLPDEPYVFTEDDATLVRDSTGARVIGPFPGHLFTWHGSRTILGLRFLSALRTE